MSWLFDSGGQSIGDSASVLPMNIELISFRIDWFDLAVQGTLKSLLQHHSSKASILMHSALFMVQLSHLYMTPGKTIALTVWTFVGKVMPLLFKTVWVSRFVIAFLPRGKPLLISWLRSSSIVTFWEPKEIKNLSLFHFSSIDLPRRDGTRCHDLCFFKVEFEANFFTLLFHPHQEAL